MLHEMTYCIVAKGKYYQARIKYKENGIWKSKSVSTKIEVGTQKNEKLAKEIARDIRDQFEREKICIPYLKKNIPFCLVVEQWYQQRCLTVKANTARSYRETIDHHILPFFNSLGLDVGQIGCAHIEKYMAYEKGKVCSNSVRKFYMLLKDIFNFAIDHDYIEKNPCNKVKAPRKDAKREYKPYSAEEIKTLLEVSKGTSLETVITLTALYGLRREEILGLRFCAIDFENNVLSINHTVVSLGKESYISDSTKNKSSNRQLPLLPEAKDLLLKVKKEKDENKKICGKDYADNDYVCVFPDGTLISPSYVSHTFKSILRKNGLREIRFHDLRHSAATNLLRNGVTPKHIQNWLGHSTISTTLDLYANLDYNDLKVVADELSAMYGR